MTTPEQAVYKLLIDTAAVTALVGTRIYPQVAPQNQLKPYIVYTLITAKPDRILVSSSTINYSRLQLDMYAPKYSEVKNLTEQVRLSLDGFRGLVTFVGGTMHIDYLALEDTNDILPAQEDGSDVPLRRVSQDYIIGNQITIPTH